VPMADSMVLARQFAAPTILTHPGGHVIPDTPSVLTGAREFFERNQKPGPFVGRS
jgi:hypothetical protein